MSECMQFPDTWEEFEQAYGFEDKKEIYTNGSRLIQSFRVKQWLDHTAEPERKKGHWTGDCCSCCGVSKYNYIKMVDDECGPFGTWNFCPHCGADMRGNNGKA